MEQAATSCLSLWQNIDCFVNGFMCKGKVLMDYFMGWLTYLNSDFAFIRLLSSNNSRQVVHITVTYLYNLVLAVAMGWWCSVAAKVTIGIGQSSHWPCITSSMAYRPVSGVLPVDQPRLLIFVTMAAPALSYSSLRDHVISVVQ